MLVIHCLDCATDYVRPRYGCWIGRLSNHGGLWNGVCLNTGLSESAQTKGNSRCEQKPGFQNNSLRQMTVILRWCELVFVFILRD